MVVGALVHMAVTLRPFVYITRALETKISIARRTFGDALTPDMLLSMNRVVPWVIIRSNEMHN